MPRASNKDSGNQEQKSRKLPENPQLNKNYDIINERGRHVTMRANLVKKDSPFWGKMRWAWRVVSNKRKYERKDEKGR